MSVTVGLGHVILVALFVGVPLVCGHERSHLQKSIPGPKEPSTPITDAPWVVTVEGTNGEEIPYLVGSIVSKDTIITSTYWIENIDRKSFFIRAGTSDRTTGGSVHNISSILTFPGAYKGHRDIGLIKVDPPFVLDETRQPIKVSINGTNDSAGIVYGYNDGGKDLSPAEAHCYSRPACNNSNLNLFGDIDESTLCLLAKGVCASDKGAGVVQNNQLVGIMSYFIICDAQTWPLIYTDFSYPLLAMWISADVY